MLDRRPLNDLKLGISNPGSRTVCWFQGGEAAPFSRDSAPMTGDQRQSVDREAVTLESRLNPLAPAPAAESAPPRDQAG
jgi:hypothetical protein